MENENYATREFPLKIETMCVRNPFDAHNPIYHPYHNTSNFVSVEEFYERYKKDNPSYELTKDYSSRKYAEYTDEMVFKSAIHILREENNGKPFNFLQEIEEILFSFNLWDDWDVLDCPRKIYYGIIKDKEIFRQLLNKYYWKPTLVINAHYQPPQVDLSELNMFSYYLQILANRSERGIYSINLYNSLEEIEEDIYGVCVFKHQQWRSKDFKEIYNSLNKQEFLRKINALIKEYGNK